MDFTTIIAILNVVAEAAPGVISTAEKLYAIGAKVFTVIQGRVPTDEEMAALVAQIDADVAEALTPLPDAPTGAAPAAS